MIVVFGGAYQGKTDFVKEKFGLKDEDIFFCGEGEIDFEKKAIAHIEKFVLERVEKGEEVFSYFEENKAKFADKIIISDDVCCGVVPLEKTLRLYRDNLGKQLQIFCREASEVYRVYCGLGERLK